MARLTLNEIYDLAYTALVRCGAGEKQASVGAKSVEDAEAEGIPNVGLGYLPIYCGHLLHGKLDGHAEPAIISQSGAVIQVDANLGFCHTAFMDTLEPFVTLTKEMGIGIMSVQRSYSAGVVGWFNDHLARHGLVSLAFANAPTSVAPWGAKNPLFGTNPLGFGAPREGHPPIVVDMATSATAKVNIKKAAATGQEIPLGWAQDADGNPTTDPKAGLAGSLLPMAGPKGFGLGLMVEVLAAGLTGGNWAHDAPMFANNEGGPPTVGQVFIAIDPSKTGGDALATRMEALVGMILAEEGVRLPGDRRHQARADAEAHGVDVPDELIARIEAFGR
ncbi:MAG: Ldh family oxidoreductase [Chloroflexota bacterium]